MKNVEQVVRTLEEIGQTLRTMEEVRSLLLEMPMEAITVALAAVRQGWRLDYESEAYSHGSDYDDHGGTEEWCLSGPGLAEPKWWHGEWDYRSHTDDMPHPATVLKIAGIGTPELRKKYGKEIVEALQVLTAVFPKKEGGEG